MTALNKIYEITEIVHSHYPWLHRIRALRDIGQEVKAGDLGGFVEHEGNLSAEPGDDAWLFDDAIVCGEGYVDRNSILREEAIVCGHAYASHGTVMGGHTRAEDEAYLRGAILTGHARASGFAMILSSQDTGKAPTLSGQAAVYGQVAGDVRLTGTALVISGEKICNDTKDTLVLDGQTRSVLREAARDELSPRGSLRETISKKKERDAHAR